MKKGFTLIELLAVIVILAIIGLIITPVVLNVVNDSKLKASKNSAQIFINKAKDQLLVFQLDDSQPIEDELLISDTNKETITVSKQPDNVCLTLNKSSDISGKLEYNGYYFKYVNDELIPIEQSEYDSIFVECQFVCGDDFLDERDDKTYKTVQIGDQCWFAENLAYTTTECLNATWDSSAPFNACRINGGTGWDQDEVLYQWSAVMNGSTAEGAQGLCPDGWYIPTDNDFKTLEMELGMSQAVADTSSYRGTDEGQQLKSITPSWNGTNTSGFNAVPASMRYNFDHLMGAGAHGFWWTSSGLSTSSWARHLYMHNSTIDRSPKTMANGYSVRCLLTE